MVRLRLNLLHKIPEFWLLDERGNVGVEYIARLLVALKPHQNNNRTLRQWWSYCGVGLGRAVPQKGKGLGFSLKARSLLFYYIRVSRKGQSIFKKELQKYLERGNAKRRAVFLALRNSARKLLKMLYNERNGEGKLNPSSATEGSSLLHCDTSSHAQLGSSASAASSLLSN
jgi:hypothetical protein